MAAAEEEEKEVGVMVLEVKGLIFISEVDNLLACVKGEENDSTQLQTADLVSTQTTFSDVSWCFILEKLQVLPSTSEKVFVPILSQLLATTAPEAPFGNERDGSLRFRYFPRSI